MNSDLDYIEQQIKQCDSNIKKQKIKIEYIRKEFEYEPNYDIQVLKRLYAKRYSLLHKKNKLLLYICQQ